MSVAEKYQLMVAGLSGNVIIGKPTKQPHIMSQDRRFVPDSEFIGVLLQWTEHRLNDGEDTLNITVDGKVVAEITIKDKSIFE